jgi:hypothetical protein
MSLNRRSFVKYLTSLGIGGGLSGCLNKSSSKGVRLTKVRLVNFEEFEDVSVKVRISYDGDKIIKNTYVVKHKNGERARPITITDLPKKPGTYKIEIVNKKSSNKSQMKVSRPNYPKCSYIDVFLHDDGQIGIYVEKCK